MDNIWFSTFTKLPLMMFIGKIIGTLNQFYIFRTFDIRLNILHTFFKCYLFLLTHSTHPFLLRFYSPSKCVNTQTGIPPNLSTPFKSSNSMIKPKPTTSPPSFLTIRTIASAVPPVAKRSSMITTF